MTDSTYQDMPAEEITAVLTEALRQELGRILIEQDQGPLLGDEEIDARIELLEQENLTLKRRARHNDFAQVAEPLRAAAQVLGITLPETIPSDLGRRAVDLFRDLKDIEGKALDGVDARTEAAPLVARFSAAPVDTFVSCGPVLLSECWERALKLYPTKSMKGNIDAIAKVAIEFLGDVPVTMITKRKQEEFFAWMARLPKSQGRSHGKNRFTEKARSEGRPVKERRQLTKQDEIDIADAADEAATEEIRAQTDICDLEKRALLVEKLVPRLTMTTLRRNRDGLNRLFKAASDLGCKEAPSALSYKEVERTIQAAAPDDPLYIRVTKPKLRMPWTEERLAQFLTCPIYTGCASEHRRWKPGSVIVRDAFYWVPLILLTVGTRIEEVLLLKRNSLRLRNQVHCLALGFTSEALGKTEDAERIIPIPQLLLDLGFVDWIKSLDDVHGPLLFPEIARRTETGKVTETFGKALTRTLGHLELADFDEDIYAARKTLSSMLRSAHVEDGQRQALAGHKSGSILNRHYTAHHTKDLKTAVDKADFKLEIAPSLEHGHPVIRACDLAPLESFSVEVVLGKDGEADAIRVHGSDSSVSLFSFERDKTPNGVASKRAKVLAAAKEFREVVGTRPLRLPRSPLKRSAIEHFHALG
ncbi:integrase [Limimaricola sp. G21655-S1]|nr:integrase [Limimaricola sp. G21655-S1]MCZ4262250.1 integrase [Limimaricola sp. G21655-S1]